MTRYYAGIGSRAIDEEYSAAIVSTGYQLAKDGWVIRSGGAKGTDASFELGCDSAKGKKLILLAENATDAAIAMAESFHPAWDKCTPYARLLLGRNCMIILGPELNSPVEMVVCYAENENKGGTALVLKIAREYGIPVKNIAVPETRDSIMAYIAKKSRV